MYPILVSKVLRHTLLIFCVNLIFDKKIFYIYIIIFQKLYVFYMSYRDNLVYLYVGVALHTI